ncbi:sensor histidine kinase [Solidesulfovibrio carbinolicus]|uniref:histidine kinase n=1 Tax=Solidesulfovibrio carbinolicus TaxID=296842 RepID=A0A4V0YQH2_9BACT|nr:ATP-binding protein [Solidesulfovibrio carbinolicus]QAZ66292.1 PAS domain-containing sensor histidine kinase [Solidesulfovibrio carbinolicus]
MKLPRYFQTRSVGGAVLMTLVCVNTLLLAVFGCIDYYGERQRLEDELRYDLRVVAEQLSANMAEPLWFLESGNLARLLDAAMKNDRLAAVVVYEADDGDFLAGRSRDRGWRNSAVTARPALDNVIIDSRPIYFGDALVGAVEVQMTRRYMDDALKQTLWRVILRILALNAALAAALVLVLRRQIIRPLARLERYAAEAARRGETAVRPEGLRGELGSLSAAMQDMVRQLTAAQDKYRDIFENATEGIFQTTFDGRLLAANAALARMIGYATPQEAMASITDLSRELYQDPNDRARLLEQLLAEGAVAGFQTRFMRRDKQTIWVLVNIRLVRDADGQPLYNEGTVVDVTARVRAERRLEILNRHLREAVKERTGRLAVKAAELEAANERLQELDRLKSGFLATVSHDLRTPLTSIMGFAKLISRDFNKFFAPFAPGHERLTRQAERITANLGIIENEGERLTRLINDFLDLSKIESGRAQWRDAEVDVSAALSRAANAVSADFAAKPEVRFTMALEGGLPPLFIDPDRLTQVLVNLLGNAAKFTDQGEVKLAASAADGLLRVVVTDTGHGIPRESLEKIFDKFHQAQLGDTVEEHGRRQGTGLGLAICRQIVEHYKGRVWAESELGRGSTFILELPLAGPPAAEDGQDQPA